MSELTYGFEQKLERTTFEEAVQKVTEALQKEGFGVLTEIDVKNTLKRKLDVDFRRYLILGACNPQLAHQALEADEHIGLLLPCNVVVQEDPGGGILVSIADPRAMFRLTESRMLQPIAEEAETRLRRVADSLS
jgi:uncharacterized protein (DUF302 family)